MEGLQAVLDAIAKMAPDDRALAERVHITITGNAPSLTPRTWYGMPAYADANDKVVVFFQDAGKFNYRYATLGFQDTATLDDGDMWPVSYALSSWNTAVEQRIIDLLKTGDALTFRNIPERHYSRRELLRVGRDMRARSRVPTPMRRRASWPHAAHVIDTRVPAADLVASAVVLMLGGCAKSGHSSSGRATAAGATQPIRTASTAPTTVDVVQHPGGSAQITVTGTIAISASGPGATCAYFYPATHQGVSYTASSATLHGTSSAGAWSLSITNDDGHHLAVLLNTDRGSWGIPVSGPIGTVHAGADLHHATFDVDLRKVIGQQHAHLSGHIDCP